MHSKALLAGASWFLSLAVVAILQTGCVAVAQQGSLPHNANAQPNGIHIKGDGVTIDWVAHMCIASLAMDAGIAGLKPTHWNTPDGTRSAALDKLTILKEGYSIYTPLQFSYQHILLDHRQRIGLAPGQTSELVTIGGANGPDTYDEDDPQVIVGGDYLLLFVQGIDPIAHGYTEKWLTVAAAFPIDPQGKVILKQQMIEQGQVTQQEQRVPLSQIAQQLAACK